MDKLIKYFSEKLPTNDNFLSLLIFLLMVFGGLYVLFHLLFYLGDNKREKQEKPKKEKPKKEPVKKEETEEKEKKEKPAKEKKEKQKKEQVVTKANTESQLIFLEEEKPYVESRPQYAHEHNDSYVVGRYNSDDIKDYSYGNNYLYDYYNDGKTVEIYNKHSQMEEQPILFEETKASDLRSKSDEIVSTYHDLPTELKKYILEKILNSGKY